MKTRLRVWTCVLALSQIALSGVVAAITLPGGGGAAKRPGGLGKVERKGGSETNGPAFSLRPIDVVCTGERISPNVSPNLQT